MAYRTTKCGHCGEVWENFQMSDLDNVGPPIIKCSTCKKVNVTKYKLYSSLNQSQSLKRRGGGILGDIFIIFLGLLLIWGYFKIKEQEFSYVALILGIIFLLLGSYTLFLTLNENKNTHQEWEDLYKKNGGFLWSDEYIKFLT